MGNKRVSQLVELTANEVANDDLFLIIDSSAHESKKIVVGDIFTYLNASGSILAVHAQFADTASFILGSNVFGSVLSASFAQNSINTVSASFAQNSINSVSASNAATASFALSAIVPSPIVTGSTYPITASVANIALTTRTSSYLQYSGFPNGTASFALSAENAVFAITASAVVGTVAFATSTSYADIALSVIGGVQECDTSSFLNFNGGFNGTASFALVAGGIEHRLEDFGLFPALTQTLTVGSLDNVMVSSSMGSPEPTLIEAFGTAVMTWTSSVENNASLRLVLLDRLTGTSGSLDTVAVDFNVSPIVNLWNTQATGSYTVPFTLVGQYPLNGNYYLAVTSSDDSLTLLPSRTVRFTISSYASYVTASNDEVIDFYYEPTNQPVTFSTFAGGPFHDTLAGILITGSNNIRTLDIGSSSISTLRYTWTLFNCTDFSCSKNASLNELNFGFPNTMSYLYCSECNIGTITDLSNTNLLVFDCHSNNLNVLPVLPDSVQYLNCSDNPITNFVHPLPTNTRQFIATNIAGATTLFGFNNVLLTASLDFSTFISLPTLPVSIRKLTVGSNMSLTTLPALSATSMSWLDASICNLSTIPSMSVSMSWIDLSSNPPLVASQFVNCTNDLVNSAQLSGTFSALGYGASFTTPFYGNLLTLRNTYNWTINVDGFP